ncbi:low molecular weight phosphatase family protein [Propionicimonas paludicola]|uniref:arsenate reductase/protein-tyrosine-phosphatase family protein n=1 Tax=Propionicimonas paludicola TaxID=185243 RepID=UPI000BF64074|nr:low molecular weight phosphatase family protein [Propionicimonas paludicola]
MTTSSPFRVLVVCTGNISRSPVVEHLLNNDLADGSLVAASAGTQAVVEAPIDPPMGDLLTGIGIDSSQFRARQLRSYLLSEVDLVLGLTREHRSAAVQLEPSVVRKSFTLREFVRILPNAGPFFGKTIGERMQSATEAAALARMRVPPTHPSDDDVMDPYGAPIQVYRRVFAEIYDAVTAITKVVA